MPPPSLWVRACWPGRCGFPPGDALFYPGTLLLALTWIGGARLSGPLPPRHRRTGESRLRVLAEALAAGLILVTIFLVGAVVVSLGPNLSTASRLLH